MAVSTGPYEQSVALEPWDYGGPEHANRVPYVAIVDADGALVDVEDGLCDLFAREPQTISPAAADDRPPPTTVAVSADSSLRALLVHPRSQPADGLVRATTLGCMDVDRDPACGRWLGRRPGRLLKFLVCRRYRAVHACDIAEALWGHAGFVSSGTVRQCVHDLRAKLEAGRQDGCNQLVVTRHAGYALNRSVVVDADDFAVHVRRGIAALDRRQREIAMVHLRHAVAMYRGDFLSDEPEADWARPERERLREHMEDALGALAELYVAAGDRSTATQCLRRLAEMRPFDVGTHRQLLTVLLSQGRHSHAWRCYEAFGARLDREFAMTPDFTLAELVTEGSEPAIGPLRLRP
jgi:DNA-binding SARP family transcriptional activator